MKPKQRKKLDRQMKKAARRVARTYVRTVNQDTPDLNEDQMIADSTKMFQADHHRLFSEIAFEIQKYIAKFVSKRDKKKTKKGTA